jgi:azurin
MRFRSIATLSLVFAAIAGSTPARTEQPQARTITITVGDPDGAKLSYSMSEIAAKPGERLRIQLVATGQMPKAVMGHNWVLLKSGVDPKAFTDDAAYARDTDFIPPKRKGEILAYTGLIGPGERADVTFTVPKAPGKYPYVCSFANHYVAGMTGVLIVK